MVLDDALVAAQRGRAVIILGAGFSRDAKCGLDQALPTGSELASELLAELGSAEILDYGLAADLYARSLGEDRLREFLGRRLTVTEATAAQISICAAPWRRIYTTNFDNVAEVARHAAGMKALSVTPREDPAKLPRQNPWCVHLHGYLAETSAPARPFPLILTRTSYIDPVLQRTPWPTQMQLDIEAADAVFVVGYSISDFHIARLLRTGPNSVRKTHIIFETAPSQALSGYVSQFGQVSPIGLDDFAARLASAATEVPVDEPEPTLVCFEEVAFPSTTTRPTTESMVGLLSLGTVDDQILAHDIITHDPPYTFYRNYALQAFSAVATGRNRFLIQSRIGNGKTIFLRQISLDFARSGYRVFAARHTTPDYQTEIEVLSKIPGKKLFIFDGYRDFENLMKATAAYVSGVDVLVAAVRTSEVRNQISDPSTALGGPFTRVNLDSLTDIEISGLESAISYYGLWGSSAGATSPARRAFIRDKCDRELRSVILHLFEKTPLGDRVKAAFGDLRQGADDALLAFTGSLLARLADCPIDFFDVCELLQADHFDTRERLRSSGAGEFFHIADDDFRARSSVLADFALSQIIDPETCLTALSQMVESLTQLYGADERYEDSVPRLLRFSVLGRVFKGSKRRDFIIKFYEGMLGIGKVRKNPQFWVQYAMARMERAEYPLAEKCFENAYTEARKMIRYNSYMIDNQYIKFLLMSRIQDDRYTDAADALSKAVPLIRRQVELMQHSADIHVLRLAEPMKQFQVRFGADLNQQSKASLTGVMEAMRDRVLAISSEGRLDDDEKRYFHMLGSRS